MLIHLVPPGFGLVRNKCLFSIFLRFGSLLKPSYIFESLEIIITVFNYVPVVTDKLPNIWVRRVICTHYDWCVTFQIQF